MTPMHGTTHMNGRTHTSMKKSGRRGAEVLQNLTSKMLSLSQPGLPWRSRRKEEVGCDVGGVSETTQIVKDDIAATGQVGKTIGVSNTGQGTKDGKPY